MASTSSQTHAVASTTLLPCSLMEAQVILAGIQSKSTLPLFFESTVFQCLQAGDYSPPLLDSQHSPDYDGSGSFPAFSYPCPLLPYCFPSKTWCPLSVASGLDLFCSAQMAVRTLQVLTDDSPSTESPEVYDVFEEAAPFLVYIRDFWIGRANCPLFAEQVLLSAESLSLSLPAFLCDDLMQQWGIPPEHRSSTEGIYKFERFPAIPIPFCLCFREGSAMMRSVPSKDLDAFASLRGKGSLAGASKLNPFAPPLEITNWELENLKADASSFLSSPRSTRSRDSDNELLSGFPSVDSAPRASLSTKTSVGRKEPRPSTTVKVVEGFKASDPPTPAMVYKRVRLPPPSLPRRSVKRVTVPKRVSKAAVKPVPERSPNSTFQPVLLADAQGRLRLSDHSTGSFTPFSKFAHARNSAPLSQENPLLAINPDFVELGSVLETQNARFTVQDLMRVNRPSIPSQACVLALARGDLETNSAPLPGYKCQACSSQS
ncbi:hypothetical protein F5879DRAFT_994917 [Lentinula edodes]|nr:hypothetical protein F5879DRAFT_994917 [Lentinula edodes]